MKAALDYSNISEIAKAYAAGIIDGEGCIKIFRVSAKALGRKSPRYQLQVQVGMTEIVAIQFLYNTFGGQIYDHPRPISYQHNMRDQKRWYICSRQAGRFVQLILPYLLIKKLHGKLVIDFMKLGAADVLKEQAYIQSRFLNRRGYKNHEMTCEEHGEMIKREIDENS